MPKRSQIAAFSGVFIVITSLVLAQVHAGPRFKVLHAFGKTEDAGLWGSLTLDASGNLYGTTMGSVFRLAPQPDGMWKLTTLHQFHYPGKGGAAPNGGLIFDPAGNLYGTTATGGVHDKGVIFELTPGPGAWKETVLYSFCPKPGCKDGGAPSSGVVMDGSGNLYGAAGVAYELARENDGWKEVVLHHFAGKNGDGDDAEGGVIRDASGDVYGTTRGGGVQCGSTTCGTVYKLTPEPDGKWKETILHRFDNNGVDGITPGGGALFMDASGDLYGTTAGGGCCGGVTFQLARSEDGHWKETILYEFPGGEDGEEPGAGVVMDAARNLYGTTIYGGDPDCDCGVVYKLAPGAKGKWVYTALHAFTGFDGAQPDANLIVDPRGNLYGTAATGGKYGGGIVFEIMP